MEKGDTPILEPWLEMELEDAEIKLLDVTLKGNIILNRAFQYTLTLGRAIIQMVNKEWVNQPLLDFINSLFKMNPSDSMLSLLTELRDTLMGVEFDKREYDGTIACLQLLKIEKQFRGNGLTKVFCELLTKNLFERFNVNYLVLIPFPTETNLDKKNEVIELKQRLENMYLNYGFKKYNLDINFNGFKTNCMYKILA